MKIISRCYRIQLFPPERETDFSWGEMYATRMLPWLENLSNRYVRILGEYVDSEKDAEETRVYLTREGIAVKSLTYTEHDELHWYVSVHGFSKLAIDKTIKSLEYIAKRSKVTLEEIADGS